MLNNTKGPLPSHYQARRPWSRVLPYTLLFVPLSFLTYLSNYFSTSSLSSSLNIPLSAQEIIDKCTQLNILPSPPPDFHDRTISDRFDPAFSPKKPIWIRNATIWTGEVAEGLEILPGDVLLDKGIVKGVGNVDNLVNVLDEAEVIDANGAWLTPGIVDLHSHIGVLSSPSLRGSTDGNSVHGITQPWLRSLDGLNTHDDSYKLSVAGGVTTSLILPGSADAIGGQAFPIKLRRTSEKSSSSLLIEPPFDLHGNQIPGRWRQLKQACGQNPSASFDGVRMDTIWAYRAAYEEAREVKVKQDTFCENVASGRWDLLGNQPKFPEDLKWEALVDVLRGKVKIHTHCYEAVDLDGLVRLTNEFNFSLAAFHHASEAYLVPELLKKAYGHPPAIALFATNARVKREAYRGSEFAPRILADNGFDVALKSDHPVINSRYVLHEAQQAHYHGLNTSLALASVTSTSARIAGLDHRIGKVKKGWDADIVLWNKHPLALGATPVQVFVDGIPQLDSPSTPPPAGRAPETPNFDAEAKAAVASDGLPSLEPRLEGVKGSMVFSNVGSLYLRRGDRVEEIFPNDTNSGENGNVLVVDGKLQCVFGMVHLKKGTVEICDESLIRALTKDKVTVDLEGGSLAPGLTTYGTPLGLTHIISEPSTQDGSASGSDPVKSIDGLLFESRDALTAYRSGVTLGIASVSSSVGSWSTAFNPGAHHRLEKGAIRKDVVAFHQQITLNAQTSVSTQITTLRKLLVGSSLPNGTHLIIEAHSADVIASLLALKAEVEANPEKNIKWTITGATEAHLVADDLAKANVGVIFTSSRPFPSTWEDRRFLPGPPLSKKNQVSYLLDKGVMVGVGNMLAWAVRNLRWDLGWIASDSQGSLSTADALTLGSVNVEKLLGLDIEDASLVATKGGKLLEFEGKMVAVVSPSTGTVDVF